MATSVELWKKKFRPLMTMIVRIMSLMSIAVALFVTISPVTTKAGLKRRRTKVIFRALQLLTKKALSKLGPSATSVISKRREASPISKTTRVLLLSISFLTGEANVQLGEISVTGAYLVELTTDKKFSFKITMKINARVWLLNALKEEERDGWLNAIAPAVTIASGNPLSLSSHSNCLRCSFSI